MSTIIDEFYILKSNNINEIDNLNNVMSSKIKEITHNHIYNQIIEDFKVWHNEKSLKEVFSEKYHNYKNVNLFTVLEDKFNGESFKFKDFYYEVFELAEKLNTECNLNKSTNIFFKTQGEKTFYRFWNSSNNDCIQSLVKSTEKLSEYNYQDQTEKPSDKNDEEWETRKKDYDILFKDSNLFEDAMNIKVIKASRNLWYKDNLIYNYNRILKDNDLLEKFNKKIFKY